MKFLEPSLVPYPPVPEQNNINGNEKYPKQDKGPEYFLRLNPVSEFQI
jgi:hypothetical protein